MKFQTEETEDWTNSLNFLNADVSSEVKSFLQSDGALAEIQNSNLLGAQLSAQGLLWRVDKEFKILSASKKVAELRGMSVAEMVGQTGFALYPTEAERYYADNLSVFETGQALLGVLEPHSSTETGERRWMRTDKFPIFDKNGNVESIIISATDVTREIELQNKSSLRHRIRTPITSILGFAELIAGGDCVDEQEARSFAKLILAQGQILLEVVEQVTETNNQDRRHISMLTAPSWINLNFFLQNWSSGSYAGDATHRLQLRGRMSPSCPAFLHVDTNVVAQILRALCDRAVNAGSATFVDLNIESIKSELGGSSQSKVLFTVQDNGKTLQEDVYNLFLQRDSQKKSSDWMLSSFQDHALSPMLMLAHKLAKAANGTLELKNNGLITGNKFVLALPQQGIQEI